MVGKHCKTCFLKMDFLSVNYTHRARFVYRSLYQDEIDRIKKRQKILSLKNKLIEHRWKN